MPWSMPEQAIFVLFAGKGHEQYQLVRGGKLPFSERRLIEETAAVCALAKVE